MKTLALTSLAVILFAASGPAEAQDARADLAAAGHGLALKICSACHVAASDQAEAPLLKPPAPSFAEIAAREGTTAASLRNFLANPHAQSRLTSKMPSFLLSASQINEVVAYLLSLKPSREPPK
jgi:mono/diheme cytochrome c family protein